VILHDNGHGWKRVAEADFGGYGVLDQVAPDGHGGLWIPMPGASGAPSALVHFSGGRLTSAGLPVPGAKINVESVALVPGSTEAIAGGFTHAAGNPGENIEAVVLQYGG
jgi:hypothetical protein